MLQIQPKESPRSKTMVQILPCIVRPQLILPMYLTPFTSLAWAYQLHYYLCFRTHCRRPSFASKAAQLTEFCYKILARGVYFMN